MNKKKPEHKDQPEQKQQPSFSGREEVCSEELSFKVVLKPDIDETVVLTFYRHYIQNLISEIEQYGRAILWDLGILKKSGIDADTEFVLEPFLNSDIWQKHLLFDHHELVGKVAQVLNSPEESPVYFLELYFPVHTILERMAGHKNISASRLLLKFQKEMDEAFPEMIRSGEGRLPDFGTLRYDELKLPWFIFEPNEKLASFIGEADHGINHVFRSWSWVVPRRDETEPARK